MKAAILSGARGNYPSLSAVLAKTARFGCGCVGLLTIAKPLENSLLGVQIGSRTNHITNVSNLT